ncbi:MAG: hypothetical protein AB1489_38765 [Acidobacteriota bacterium]
MRTLILILVLLISQILVTNVYTQDIRNVPTDSTLLNPIDTVKTFYRLLREKRYLEGFRLSVYRSAIESLNQEELKELEPDFETTFANIPEMVKVFGSQVSGDKATVFIKASEDPKDYTAEEVALIRVDKQWVVGDADTLKLVNDLGRKFFFKVRMDVNEETAHKFMDRYIGAEKLFFDNNKGVYGNIDDLIGAGYWPENLKSGEINGYKFTIELENNRKTFWVHAEPITYNKTGHSSFYGDLSGVYKFDNGGRVYRVQLKTESAK